VRHILNQVRLCAEILGLDLFSFVQGLFVTPQATALLQQREEARKRKDWKEADRLRGEILALGYVIEDTPQGPRLLPKAGA
jgi:cysteinyl-tRNA synthetase